MTLAQWHLGFCKDEYLPTNRGFDSHYGIWTLGVGDYDKMNGVLSPSAGYDFRDNMGVVPKSDDYLALMLSDRAEHIVNTHYPGTPHFLAFTLDIPAKHLEATILFCWLQLYSIVDIHRTILDVAGAKAEPELDGLSMWPTWIGDYKLITGHPDLLYPYPDLSLTDNYYNYGDAPASGLPSTDQQSHAPAPQNVEYLFNVVVDPEERNDISAYHPDWMNIVNF
ncbi:uncharacterized protein LOC144347215 [Saccoglossus kowalevskii]